MLRKVQDTWVTKLLKDRSVQVLAGAAVCYGIYRIYKSRKSFSTHQGKGKILNENHVNQSWKKDKHTLSNFEDFVTTTYHLQLEVDFDKKRLIGSNTIRLTSQGNMNSIVTLDAEKLMIHSVNEMKQGDLDYEIVNVNGLGSIIGHQLRVRLKTSVSLGEEITLRIRYETLPESTAICWADPMQTEGKVYNYMYTQSEPIHARTLFPCQDTPIIKSPFTAQISVKAPYQVYTSGLETGSRETGGMIIKDFTQNIPIPSYLVAFLVGNLREVSINARNSVVSEPEVMDKYVKELDIMEEYLSTLEGYLDMKYDWENYKLAILPGSFAYRGMENPNLTFGSPCIMAGDKSGTTTVVHEMAHSWTGNLVTNANWECFWLNEGFTRFLERKALQIIKGKDIYDILCYIGFNDLKFNVQRFGPTHEYTKLLPDLTNKNPEEAISPIPYEKGFYFLTYLEDLIGYEEMRAFLKVYLTKFRFLSVTITDFQETFKMFVKDHVKDGEIKLSKINWDHWLHQPGVPTEYKPELRKGKIVAIEELADKYIKTAGHESPEGHEELKASKADTYHIIIFLDYFLARPNEVTFDVVNRLNLDFHYHKTAGSAEILYRWFALCLRGKIIEVYPHIVDFLGRYGTLRYLKVLYTDLANIDVVFGKSIFEKHKGYYQQMAVSLVEGILSKGLSKGK